MLSEPTAVTLKVIDTLEAIGIRYLIGGSFASSIHGIARMTADVDLVVDLSMEQVDPLVRALEKEFYMDAEAIRDAIRRHESFNLVHLATMFKVDAFILKRRPFDDAQFERRQRRAISADPERYAYRGAVQRVPGRRITAFSENFWRNGTIFWGAAASPFGN